MQLKYRWNASFSGTWEQNLNIGHFFVSRLENGMHNILPDDILYMHHNRPNVTCDK